MMIRSAEPADADQIAFIVSHANKDVAKQFKLNHTNAPKHPSFYTTDWVLSDFERGETYFLYRENEVLKGCVAFEQSDPETAYLNRLAVLPAHRHQGIGAALVKHILNYSKVKNVKKVSIGIIAEHELLKKWYLKLGFIEGDIVQFDHLPFNVQFMSYNIEAF